MKTLKWILPLFTLCIMLAGCPYYSQVPLDKPTLKVNPALFGIWQSDTAEGDVYKIEKGDDYTYAISQNGKSWNETKNYKAYFTQLDNETYLNLWAVDKDAPNYAIYKIDITANKKIVLKPVTENITEQFKTSAGLMAFIKKYRGLSFFYGKDVTSLSKQ